MSAGTGAGGSALPDNCDARGCTVEREIFQADTLSCAEDYASAQREYRREPGEECASAFFDCNGQRVAAYEHGSGSVVECFYGIDDLLIGGLRTSGDGAKTLFGAVHTTTCYRGPDCSVNDRTTLLACEVEEPCLKGSAQIVEGSLGYVNVERNTCILEALRLRTPGRYLHWTDHTWGNGSKGAHHTLVVREDGTVLYGRETYAYNNGTMEAPVRSGELCTLREPSYFERCLQTLEAVEPMMTPSDAAGRCVMGDRNELMPSAIDWFERCEDATSQLECPNGSL